MKWNQIDNKKFNTKLALRRFLLERYHRDSAPRVLNCCEGEGNALWGRLKEEIKVESYLGLDLKKRRGALSMDSRRFLAEVEWDFDFIDIDVYGCPFGHLNALADNFRVRAATVAVTWGKVKAGGGSASKAALSILGLEDIIEMAPSSLLAMAADEAFAFWLGKCKNQAIMIAEAWEGFPQSRTRYLGFRMERDIDG